MSEMADAGEEQRHSSFRAQFDGVVIAFRAARLYDHPNTRIDQQFWTVWKGKEPIGGGDRIRRGCKPIAGFLDREAGGGHAIHLACASSEQARSISDCKTRTTPSF